MTRTKQQLTNAPEFPVDNTNHDLIHTLSVRLDAQWHDGDYGKSSRCPQCQAVFGKLREMDQEAVRLLSTEITNHVHAGRFPLDLVD